MKFMDKDRRRQLRYRQLLVAALMLSAVIPARAMECGDVDGSGEIRAADALVVLKRAVGLQTAALQCPDSCPVVTTTSTVTSTTGGDECFSDQECQPPTYPPGLVCDGPNGTNCVECGNDDDCDPPLECVAWECVGQ